MHLVITTNLIDTLYALASWSLLSLSDNSVNLSDSGKV